MIIDKNAINEYIKRVQKEFPDVEINIHNVNDYSRILRERELLKSGKITDSDPALKQGYKAVMVNGELKLTECDWLKEEKAHKQYNEYINSLVPENVRNASIEKIDTNTESRKKVFGYLMNFLSDNEYKNKKGLYLYGGFSIGKTYILAAFSNELNKRGIGNLLIYFPDLVIELKSAISDSYSNKYEKMIEMLKSIPVLMIDDLGSENMTPWLRDEILGPVLNFRQEEGLPVFISSNISPKDYAAHLNLNNSDQDKTKANRIYIRLQSLIKQISLDDTEKYKR